MNILFLYHAKPLGNPPEYRRQVLIFDLGTYFLSTASFEQFCNKNFHSRRDTLEITTKLLLDNEIFVSFPIDGRFSRIFRYSHRQNEGFQVADLD